jgi:hypothetical protein
VDYAGEWIEAHPNPRTRGVLWSTLRRIESELGTRTLAQVAGDRELAQRLVSEAPGSYKARTRVLIVSPLNETRKAGRIASHRLEGLRVEVGSGRAEFAFASRESLEALAGELGEFGLAVWTGRLLGLRVGESLALRKSDSRDGGTVLRLTRTRAAEYVHCSYKHFAVFDYPLRAACITCREPVRVQRMFLAEWEHVIPQQTSPAGQ